MHSGQNKARVFFGPWRVLTATSRCNMKRLQKSCKMPSNSNAKEVLVSWNFKFRLSTRYTVHTVYSPAATLFGCHTTGTEPSPVQQPKYSCHSLETTAAITSEKRIQRSNRHFLNLLWSSSRFGLILAEVLTLLLIITSTLFGVHQSSCKVQYPLVIQRPK